MLGKLALPHAQRYCNLTAQKLDDRTAVGQCVVFARAELNESPREQQVPG
jgi:hypothetical protein